METTVKIVRPLADAGAAAATSASQFTVVHAKVADTGQRNETHIMEYEDTAGRQWVKEVRRVYTSLAPMQQKPPGQSYQRARVSQLQGPSPKETK